MMDIGKLKQLIRNTWLYDLWRRVTIKGKWAKELEAWERRGCRGPAPHLLKQRVLKTYAQQYGLKTLVETGTFYGDMVHAMKDEFDKIYSIELCRPLFEKCKRRFRNERKVVLICGDSGVELKNVVGELQQPALFWLDGHYSAGNTAKGERDTPIFSELTHVLTAKERGHVVVIDDARCFGADPDYPSLSELIEFVTNARKDLEVTVKDDSIRVTPIR